MAASSRIGTARFLLLALVGALVLPLGCQQKEPPGVAKGGSTAAAIPPPTPGLEPQDEDFVKARTAFRTKLLRQGATPQRWHKVRVPPGVTEVEYASGELRLKAWASRPAAEDGRKVPAVLYLHGGFAFDLDDWQQSQPFRDAGNAVLTPLLRGENGQPGAFTMLWDEVDDVLAAADRQAKVPGVHPGRIYVAGHSAGGTLAMLAAMASGRFRAAASLSGSPDRVAFVQGGWAAAAPFDPSDRGELRSGWDRGGRWSRPACRVPATVALRQTGCRGYSWAGLVGIWRSPTPDDPSRGHRLSQPFGHSIVRSFLSAPCGRPGLRPAARPRRNAAIVA
jgi:hypothetical protein